MAFYCHHVFVDSTGNAIGEAFQSIESMPGYETAFSTTETAQAFCSSINAQYDAVVGSFLYSGMPQNGVTLQDLFNVPVSTDLEQMFSLGFGLPILCYLVAWGYGSVINFFRQH